MLRISLVCALGCLISWNAGCRAPSATSAPIAGAKSSVPAAVALARPAPQAKTSEAKAPQLPSTTMSTDMLASEAALSRLGDSHINQTVAKKIEPVVTTDIVDADGGVAPTSPSMLSRQMTLGDRTLAGKKRHDDAIRQAAMQDDAGPMLRTPEGRPAPEGVLVGDDPAAVPGGPRYPKQQLPIEQSIAGYGAAIPVTGMVLGNCDCGPCGGGSSMNAPLRGQLCGNNWKPEGLYCPWPSDEYLCDGGDNDAHVRVQPNFTVTGLDLEDTVAHYDTVDGQVKVEHSNKVCIYAPRFAAVRRVDGLHSGDQHVKAGDVILPIGPKRVEENQLVVSDSQPLPPLAEVGRKRVTIYDGQDKGLPLVQNVGVLAFQDRIHLNSDLKTLTAYRLDESLKPFLAKKSLAAMVWTRDQMVQAIIDGKKALADQGSQGVQAVYRIDTGKPRLRITKAASTDSANPGDIVEFVLRFDNIGEQTIGNVTLIDNLTTRLEYVEGSQQCSLNARFMTQQNTGESLVLRWEVTDPIKAGDGGVIVFKCKVR